MDSSEKNVLVIAHRGASDLAPENSLKAFQKAIEGYFLVYLLQKHLN